MCPAKMIESSKSKLNNAVDRKSNWQLFFISEKSLDLDFYILHVKRSPYHEKIINDSFRTLKTNKEFQSIVHSDIITRVLSASVNQLSSKNSNFSYVQGMNVTLAPFLFTMNELPAFYCYTSFINNTCPTYVYPNLDGVHAGVKIFDVIFKTVDEQLYTYLRSKGLSSEVFAFSAIMTFCASLPPLGEVLILWDFYVKNGFELNIIVVLAHLLTLRSNILASDKPSNLLRNWPPIQANLLIKSAQSIYSTISSPFKMLLRKHLVDPELVQRILEQ